MERWIPSRVQPYGSPHALDRLLSARSAPGGSEKQRIQPRALSMNRASLSCERPKRARRPRRGFTLVELIVATSILIILTSLAIPMARVSIKREKERELRRDLWEMRDAIDRYKDAADRNAFQTKVGTQNYPPDL